MDYEKKYKEALERARKLWNEAKANEYTSDIEDYETIFPELAESEDERVRNWLVISVNNMADCWFADDAITREIVLAWLEKQKEQKPAKIKVVYPNNPKRKEKEFFYSEKEVCWEDLPIELRMHYYDYYFRDGMDYYPFKPDDEQKPMRYIYIPKFRSGDKIVSIKNPHLTYNIRKTGIMDESGELCYECEIFADGKSDNDIKLLSIEKVDSWGELVKQKEQKQEWSEGDKIKLDNCCAVIAQQETYFDTTFRQKCLDFLYELPNRFDLPKKQEWSEEDEEMIERLIRHTQKEYDELCNDRYGHQEIISDLKESCRERMNWLEKVLKSLRPQPNKWYIKKGHWYMCIVDKPEYGWTKGKVYQSPEDNRIETDYKGDLTNWPNSEPWFRPATRDEIPDSLPRWKPSEEQISAIVEALKYLPNNKEEWAVLDDLIDVLKKLKED